MMAESKAAPEKAMKEAAEAEAEAAEAAPSASDVEALNKEARILRRKQWNDLQVQWTLADTARVAKNFDESLSIYQGALEIAKACAQQRPSDTTNEHRAMVAQCTVAIQRTEAIIGRFQQKREQEREQVQKDAQAALETAKAEPEAEAEAGEPEAGPEVGPEAGPEAAADVPVAAGGTTTDVPVAEAGGTTTDVGTQTIATQDVGTQTEAVVPGAPEWGKVITVTFTKDKLGVTLTAVTRDGKGKANGDTRDVYIIVDEIKGHNSEAYGKGVLHSALRSVGGTPVGALSFNETMDVIRKATRPLAIEFTPRSEPSEKHVQPSASAPSAIHVLPSAPSAVHVMSSDPSEKPPSDPSEIPRRSSDPSETDMPVMAEHVAPYEYDEGRLRGVLKQDLTELFELDALERRRQQGKTEDDKGVIDQGGTE